MDITYIAETCFRARGKEGTVLISPTDAVMTQEADIALLSVPGSEEPSRLRLKRPALAAPGEFEYGGVLLNAYGTYQDHTGKDAARNLIWVITLEDMVICHLGLLGHALSKEEADVIGPIDILMFPVGAKLALKGDQLATIIGELDPHLCIPYTPESADDNVLKKATMKLADDVGIPVGEFKQRLSINRSGLGADSASASFVLLEPKK